MLFQKNRKEFPLRTAGTQRALRKTDVSLAEADRLGLLGWGQDGLRLLLQASLRLSSER